MIRALLLILALTTTASAAAYRTHATGGSTTGTSNRTVAITPAVGDLFIGICAVAANTNSTPTASDDNGGSYTFIRVQTILIGAVNYRLSAFVRNSLLANTTSTTFTCTTGSNTSGHATVVAFSGMARSGANAIKQSAGQDDQAAGTPGPTFSSAALTGNAIVGLVQNGTNPATMTIPTGFSAERVDAGFASDANGLHVVTRDSGFTGTTVTWGSSSASRFASIIIELDNSAAPASARRPIIVM